MPRKNVLIIVAMAIGIFLCMLDTTVMNVALPDIQSGLNVKLSSLSWALNIYTILFASLTIPLGKVAERLGINKTYLSGLVIFTVGSALSASAPSLAMLVGGRAIQSIGAAIVFPLSMSIGINSAQLVNRKKVIAILGITQGLAAALGPTIGGCLTQFLSWRWIFIINILLSIVSVVICLGTLELRQATQADSIDYGGSILSMITLFAFTLALVEGRTWGWHSTAIIGLFITALFTFICFIFYERKVSSPMIPLALFHNREFTGSALTIVLSNLFLVAVTVVLPTYFTRIQGKSELVAALLITPITGMIFVFSPLSAFIIERLGSRLVIAGGFLLMTISFILFATIDMKNIYLVITTCLILGMGYGVIAGPITVLAAADFKGSLLNASQSVAGVLRQIGISLAVAIYVTGLYGNLVVAKNNSVTYIQNEVATLKIPSTKKQILAKKAIRSLSSQTKATPQNHFTNKDRAALIQQNYQQALATTHSTGNPQLYKHVQHDVDKRIITTNHTINLAIAKIKSYARKQYEHAFVKLYQYSIIFVLLSTLSCFLFPRKRKHSS